MSETSELNGTQQPQAPPEAVPCEDCAATTGERLMGAVALAIAVAVALMAIDLISGGKAWGLVKGQVQEQGD